MPRVAADRGKKAHDVRKTRSNGSREYRLAASLARYTTLVRVCTLSLSFSLRACFLLTVLLLSPSPGPCVFRALSLESNQNSRILFPPRYVSAQAKQLCVSSIFLCRVGLAWVRLGYVKAGARL